MTIRNRAFGPGAVLVAFALWLVPATPAVADYPFNARGEIARLGRQLYDFHYRNSNNNVYRRSNHNHPTKNVFRSSRYYEKRLAASYAGYPVRTIYHDGRGRQRSIVYPRRHPYGPSFDGRYPNVVGCAQPAQPIYIIQEAPPAPAPEPEPRVTRETIEMVPVRVVQREPKERAVLERVTQADGSVKTFIRSVPIGEEPSDEPLADRQESRDEG